MSRLSAKGALKNVRTYDGFYNGVSGGRKKFDRFFCEKNNFQVGALEKARFGQSFSTGNADYFTEFTFLTSCMPPLAEERFAEMTKGVKYISHLAPRHEEGFFL